MTTQLYLTPRNAGRTLSLEEFENASGQEGYHYELINGTLEVSPLPDMSHEDLRDWLRDKLCDYVRQHPDVINYVKAPARVFVSKTRDTTAPEPDVAAYSDFPPRRRWQDFSPILVAEILSADSADKDLIRNRDLYLQVPSIREYWIIDPRSKAEQPTLTVYRRRGQRWQQAIDIAGGDTYTTRLLPNFTLVMDVCQ